MHTSDTNPVQITLKKQARVADLAHDAILVIDTQGTIRFWNRGAEQLYGWKREEAIGRNAHELLRTVFPKPLAEIRADLLRDGQWRGELEHTTRDGHLVIVASRWNIDVDEHNRPVGTFEINRDITTQKHAEEALLRSEKLAAAGRLAATVAHEINNPLEAVTNLLYLACTDEKLDPTTREYLSLAERELQRVSQLTKQTLGFYRDSSRPEPVNVSEILDEVLTIYSGRLQAKGIRLQKRFDRTVAVLAGPGELRQVFSNLVVNALDALSHGGTLAVRVSRVGGGRGARITIADTGVGISPEHRDNIFEPFFTTKKDVGTGLGLWVAQEIVHKYEGQIRMRSSVHPGASGSVFSVFLPAITAVTEISAQCA